MWERVQAMQAYGENRYSEGQRRERAEDTRKYGLPNNRSNLWNVLQQMRKSGVCGEDKEQSDGEMKRTPGGPENGE